VSSQSNQDGYCFLKLFRSAHHPCIPFGQFPSLEAVLEFTDDHMNMLSDKLLKVTVGGNLVHLVVHPSGHPAVDVVSLLHGLKVMHPRHLSIGGERRIVGQTELSDSEDDMAEVLTQAYNELGSWAPTIVGAAVIGFATGSFFATTNRTVERLRPDWYGHCYKLIVNIDMRGEIPLGTFLELSDGLPLVPGEVSFRMNNGVIHVTREKPMYTASQARQMLSEGYIVVSGRTIQVDSATLIGAMSNQLVRRRPTKLVRWVNDNTRAAHTMTIVLTTVIVAVPIMPLVLEYMHEWYLMRRGGHCYRRLVRIDVGRHPLLSYFLERTINWPLLPGRVLVSYSKNMVHIEHSEYGRDTLDVMTELRRGQITVGNAVYQLQPNTRIGGQFSTPVLTTIALAAATTVALPFLLLARLFLQYPELYEASKTWGLKSSPTDGRCYRCIHPEDVGPNVNAIEWAQNLRNRGVGKHKVSLSIVCNHLHARLNANGIPANEVVMGLAAGWVDIDGKLIQIKSTTLIGYSPPNGYMMTTLVVCLMWFATVAYGYASTPLMVAFLWTLFVMQMALKPGKPVYKFLLMGTRGDKLAPTMYANQLKSIGANCTIQDTTPGIEGSSLLLAVEQRQLLLPVAKLFKSMVAGLQSVKDGSVTYHGHAGTYINGSITYNCSAHRRLRSPMQLTSIPFINKMIDCHRFDIDVESMPWCAGRSADGLTLIRQSKNKGFRKTLIALGSSSLPEPDHYDPSTTWSTRPSSRYQYDDRVDHNDIFPDYETIVHHGGAGVDRTARACGCGSVAIDDSIDRAHNDDVGHQLYFTKYMAHWWLLSFHAMDWQTKMHTFSDHFQLVENPFKLVIVMMAMASTAWMASKTMFTLLCLASKSLMDARVLDGISGLISMSIISQGAISITGSIASACIKNRILTYAREKGWFTIIKDAPIQLAKLQHECSVNVMAIRTIMGATSCGWLPAILILKFCSVIYDKLLTGVSVAALSFDFIASGFDNLAVEDLRKDRIYIAMDVMNSDLFDDLFYCRHVAYLNGATYETIGITQRDDMCVGVERRPLARSRGQRFIEVPIHLEKWESLCSDLLGMEGHFYGPWNNCQTNTLYTLWHYAKETVDAPASNLAVIMSAFTCLTVYSFGIMASMGGCFVVVSAAGAVLKSKRLEQLSLRMLPRIAFASHSLKHVELRPIWGMVTSIWTIFDGPIVVTKGDDYPLVEPYDASLKPTTLQMMRLKVGPSVRHYLQPCTGWNRPDYTTGRSYESHKHLHNITDEGMSSKLTASQIELMEEMRSNPLLLTLTGKIAVIATSCERPISDEVLSIAAKFDDYVVLTNGDGGYHNQIILNCSGRELACNRLNCPTRNGVIWVSMNSSYSSHAAQGLSKLLSVCREAEHHGVVAVSTHGLNPGPAGLLAYTVPILHADCMDLSIYGAEEVAIAQVPAKIYIADVFFMFNSVRKQTSFKCLREVVLFDAVTSANICMFRIDNWSAKDLVDGLSDASVTDSIGITQDGVTVNNNVVDLAPVVSDMYPEGKRIEEVVSDMTMNSKGFLYRLDCVTKSLMKNADGNPVTSAVATAYYKVCDVFTRGDRERPKKLWAPVHTKLSKIRSEELKTQIHANPVFVKADFESTMSHYIKHLNFAQHDKSKILSPTEYRRRVNRSPYVDTYLKEKMPDAFQKGIDASTLACRQVMLESLARYNKDGFYDSMTTDDINGIATAIFNKYPDMLSDATLADPVTLTKKFLSYKKYSAGLPFTYAGSGINKRADLRKQGWLHPLAKVALLPYKTGEWYPAIAHAFPKSQVVERNKIANNPAKMRSIVATAGFNNVQQGVMNYDLNNRHDYFGTNEKVGMPLIGSHLNHVFADLERFDYAYSLDVTAMDANLSDGVLKVVAELRKKGFQNHPAREAIYKHIDCAMEQTKYSYVLNLIDDDVDKLIGNDPLITSVKKWARDKGDWAIKSDMVPGGVLHKTRGGSTGDSNVTFNNTKGLAVIVMYCYCKATGTPYDNFFDTVGLHNFGDDDLLGTNSPPAMVQKMVDIANEDLGIQMRFEAKGTDILSQTFLGRTPHDAQLFRHDFERAGISMPKYAIMNERNQMLMRLASEKAEMVRHKGVRHELYRLEKAMGYANLTAHQEDIHTMVVEYFDEVISRLPTSLTTQKWFKKKYKVTPYLTVLKKWYKPLTPEDFNGVHCVQMQISLLTKTERSFLTICKALQLVSDVIPSHLVVPEDGANAYRISELYTGIFESHAWHNYVAKHGEPPTNNELLMVLRNSPYSQFCNVPFWQKTVGASLPTQGALFERNYAHATWMMLLYTGVYMKTNKLVHLASRLPLGNVFVELFNLHTYTSRRLFGALGYTHYIAAGCNSPVIDALVPKDPFAYHKRAAGLIMNTIPKFRFLGFIPIHKVGRLVVEMTKILAKTNNTSLVANGDLGNQDNLYPWQAAIEECKQVMIDGSTPVLVSHTGTGKTKYTPGLLLQDPILKPSMVVVAMPRIIVCEQWAATSGAIFKTRHNKKLGPLVTCTYGYLNHCAANDAVWWDEDTLFVFDEAHEESSDWYQLRRTFLPHNRCIAMTATPAATTCAGFKCVMVNVIPRWKIMDLESESLEDAIAHHIPRSKRFLIVEPSKKRCLKIIANLAATGIAAKLVWSGDREIPDNTHIVATSVVESSITIPGCDLVIDTGDRIVNDGGRITRVPNDEAGAIQRRGRTGRTNDGISVRITKPVNINYKPVPEVNAVLSKSRAVEALKTRIPFDPAPKARAILVDQFATCDGIIPQTLDSITLLQLLVNSGCSPTEVEQKYERVRLGRIVEELEHYFVNCDIQLAHLRPYEQAICEYTRARVVYKINGKAMGNKVIIDKHLLRTEMVDCNWEAEADNLIKHGISTPKSKRKSVRRRPKRYKRESA